MVDNEIFVLERPAVHSNDAKTDHTPADGNAKVNPFFVIVVVVNVVPVSGVSKYTYPNCAGKVARTPDPSVMLFDPLIV